eukprot:1082243-Pyramimonas_sp.AAC.1
MTELRRLAAQCSVGAGPGRRLTTSLAMVYGNKDPAKSLKMWLKMRRGYLELHARVATAWVSIRRRLLLAGSRRWRLVRGPIGAAIATLMDI